MFLAFLKTYFCIFFTLEVFMARNRTSKEMTLEGRSMCFGIFFSILIKTHIVVQKECAK